jgi:hypothetical protein
VNYIIWVALAFIVGLFFNRFLPSYFQKKGENLATKEDLAELTRIAESIKVEHQLLLEQTKPFTAEETLRRQVFFNSKLEAFYSALDIVCRNFAANEMHIHDTNKTHNPAVVERPSEREINLAYGRMAMFAGDRAVLDKFQQIHGTKSSPADIGTLVNLMRSDLGFSDGVVPGESYAYMLGSERTSRPTSSEANRAREFGDVAT